MIRICAAVLAAGTSSRMGIPKQLLPWGDKTLLTKVLEVVTPLTNINPVVVLGASSTEIQKILPEAVTILYNPNYQSGLFSSLLCAITYASKTMATHILVVLGDQPGIETTYLQAMMATADLNPLKIINSNYTGKPGVPAIIPKQFFSELVAEKYSDKGAKEFFRKNKEEVIIMPPYNRLFDIDTLEDYDRYK